MASYQDGVPIEKNDVKGGVPVEEKENNVNNINREVFQNIISRGSIVGRIIYHIIDHIIYLIIYLIIYYISYHAVQILQL